MAIEINDFSECESISLATGCPIIGDLSEITSDQKVFFHLVLNN